MKTINIRFFSSIENTQAKLKTEKAVKPAKVILTGYISSTGKLVFPAKTMANLGLDLSATFFKVGMDQDKRKAKSLYLVPSDANEQTFSFDKAAKSYTLSLPFILKNSGVDYSKVKYEFKIRPFDYEGTTAFELQLASETNTVKEPYTGKPRGRKAKQDSTAQ